MLDTSRHEKLLGKETMEKISQTNVLVAGAGGLGSTVLQLLVRLGFSNITIVDPKIVDPPDLNRQILYTREDLGKHKALIAKERLLSINPSCEILSIIDEIDENFNLEKNIDIVIDCFDNFESRFILESWCEKKGIPFVHGGVEEYRAQVTVIIPGKTKSLKEIYFGITTKNKPQVFPPTVIITASLQVNETIKLLKGDLSNALVNKILFVDILKNEYEILSL
ncbi:HesA/MoeB/ThiF family protein [Thermosipho ferrireducens]|uniref:HesA/MoeB/ThiF family protein n=1 Tax=Thermosipho ferrireducens TaxID=2571116 RepID=A0ABX7S4F4_9BACT|nr:HesA/MoeB/ThiF family protein [Thermosipho ferrireducens]QTA37327.1 HesA/MoeB/ThiF family protein [Thermosipho ferrireducens]